jgi:peptide deformylase
MKILTEWNELLRKKSLEIKDFNSSELTELVESLKEELIKLNWVWLAAPQYWIMKRIFIVHSFPNNRYPNAPEFWPIEIINPRIINTFDEVEKDWEWCLNVPWIKWFKRAKVERPKKIEVEYFNVQWIKYTKNFKWFIARIFQHEYDHLEWILFVDKVDKEDLIEEEEYLKIIK